MDNYDIRSIFEEIELDLIASMRRNLSRHRKEENEEGFNWSMWQVEQLKSLEKFKAANDVKYKKDFSFINAAVSDLLEGVANDSAMQQESEILKQIQKGHFKTKKGLEGSFFNPDNKRLNSMIKSVADDLKKAEHAMLRLTDDKYRQIIYRTQVAFTSGSKTLDQSIDKAMMDFVRSGINCVEYKDGRRVNIATYAEMALRTANTRAKLIAEGEVRKDWGIHTVKISKYGGCSETCEPWQGRVYVDDVYSGGTKEEARKLNLPLLSEAIAGGLFHPNCRHTASTYFIDSEESSALESDAEEYSDIQKEMSQISSEISRDDRKLAGFKDDENLKAVKNKRKNRVKKLNDLKREELRKLKIQNVNIPVFLDDITDDYISKAKPLTGKVLHEKTYRLKTHTEETQMANWISGNFGGKITLLTEKPKEARDKNPDYLWHDKYWEYKIINSANNIDSQTRKAIHQISDVPGGIALEIRDNEASIDKIVKDVGYRLGRSCKEPIDVIIKNGDQFLIIRNKKQDQ